jgi:hypothetical protein
MKINYYLFIFYTKYLIKLRKTCALSAINFIILTKYFCLLGFHYIIISFKHIIIKQIKWKKKIFLFLYFIFQN